MRGLVIPTIAKVLLVLLGLLTLSYFWYKYFGKGSETFSSSFNNVKQHTNVLANASKCFQLYQLGNCDEFYQLQCDKILNIKCEGGEQSSNNLKDKKWTGRKDLNFRMV